MQRIGDKVSLASGEIGVIEQIIPDQKFAFLFKIKCKDGVVITVPETSITEVHDKERSSLKKETSSLKIAVIFFNEDNARKFVNGEVTGNRDDDENYIMAVYAENADQALKKFSRTTCFPEDFTAMVFDGKLYKLKLDLSIEEEV